MAYSSNEYIGKQVAQAAQQICMPAVVPITEQVERQLQQAKAEVERLSALLDLLKANPDIDRIMTLMQRGLGNY